MEVIALIGNPGGSAAGIALAIFLVVTPGTSWLFAQSDSASTPDDPRQVLNFDSHWRFLKGDAPGAETAAFDDSAWRSLSLPHDWSIEGPFDAKSPVLGWGGYLPCGVSWYRKAFELPADWAGRKIFVDFDGVMSHSQVWINGHLLGMRPNGYISFRYDLTPWVQFGAGKSNVLSVRTDTSQQPASRWYAGAGIYRKVWLLAEAPVHVDHWGVFVTTPRVSDRQATVRVQTTLVNQTGKSQGVLLRTTLIDPAQKRGPSVEATRSLAAGGTELFTQELEAIKPALWDLDTPNLYHIETAVLVGGKVIDRQVTPFGIRTMRFEPATGFYLNGRNIKIKGVCLHHDAGGVGIAVPLAIWQKRFAQLKGIGCNAIRTSHNPVDPGFLDLADRMGLLILDEAYDVWGAPKRAADGSTFFGEWAEQDLRDMILRDRNHPSIFLYSTGNEIPIQSLQETVAHLKAGSLSAKDPSAPAVHASPLSPGSWYDSAHGPYVFEMLRDIVHETDPTRPETIAMTGKGFRMMDEAGVLDQAEDVTGSNYSEQLALDWRHRKPETRKIICTETGPGLAAWRFVKNNPDLAGQFLWTGYAYFGEVRNNWPAFTASFGIIDRTGLPRPVALDVECRWATDKPVVYVLRQTPLVVEEKNNFRHWSMDWNPEVKPGSPVTAVVLSTCPQVELFLNGRSLGQSDMPGDCAPLDKTFPYEPGTLRVVGKKDGKDVCSYEMKTAGPPAGIRLESDQKTLRNDWDDAAYLRVSVVDSAGTVVPTAAGLVNFTIDGPGHLLAVDNGSYQAPMSFRGNQCPVFRGHCLAVLQADHPEGTITVTADAGPLGKATATLRAMPAARE